MNEILLRKKTLLIAIWAASAPFTAWADIPNAVKVPDNLHYHADPETSVQYDTKKSEQSPDLFGETTGPLPFFGKQIRERGYDLPDPYGIGYNYMNMRQNIKVNSINFSGLSVFGQPIPSEAFNIGVGKTREKSKTNTARLDAWIFPFMNIYGIIGHTKGTSTSTVDVTSTNKDTGETGTLFKDIDFILKFKGTTWGGGTTIAYGYHNWFGTLDFNYTQTNFDTLDGKTDAFTFTPRVGYRFTVPGFSRYSIPVSHASIWIGTMYQDVTQDFHGQLSKLGIPGDLGEMVKFVNSDGNGQFRVKQHLKSPWNMLMGAQYELTRNFNLTAEVGFQKRNSLMLGGEFRF